MYLRHKPDRKQWPRCTAGSRMQHLCSVFQIQRGSCITQM